MTKINKISLGMLSVIALAGLSLPAKAMMPGGSTIYAGLWTTTEATPQYGIYSLDPDGSELLLPDPKGSLLGFPIRSAWIADGKLCGYYVKESYSIVEALYYIELNANGEVLIFNELPDDVGYMFTSTYNPDDQYIYGYGLTADYSYALMRAPVSDPGDIQSVREFSWDADEECLSLAYNTADQKLYGINAKGKFVKIETGNGRQTIIADAPRGADSMISGMCYSPKEDLFYWNPQFSSGSAIYTISVDGTQFEKVYDCPNDEQYNFMICPDKATVASSPLAPEIKSINFDKGALTGNIIIGMPSQSVNSESLTGTLALSVVLDGENLRQIEGEAGSEVTVDFENLTEGIHTFSFKALNGEAASEFASRTLWIGVDTPKPTSNVTLTASMVGWEPVSEGENGGYIDLDNLTYNVYFDDVFAFSQSSQYIYGEHNLKEADVKRYQAKVIVSAGGKSSAPAFSNEVALGRPAAPDFTLVPDREDVEKMTVLDINEDGRTWSYSLYQECAKSSFGSGIPMDDWLILFPIAFEQGEEYELSFDVQACSSIYTEEYMRVCIGDDTQPDAMLIELIPTFNPLRELETRTVTFTLPITGTYYIGFHNNSAADQEGILLSNIRLKTGGASVAEIGAASSEAEYFTLQGVRIQQPTTGLYIERRGTTTRKILLP